jgi:hypothetical protein
LRINGNDVFTSALVLESLSEELVIGAEFFQSYKVVLDPDEKRFPSRILKR